MAPRARPGAQGPDRAGHGRRAPDRPAAARAAARRRRARPGLRAGQLHPRVRARRVGDGGLVVGVDASRTMLARAVRDTPPEADNVAWVRGDGDGAPVPRRVLRRGLLLRRALPLRRAVPRIDELARVLTPGGRIAILTSCRTRSTDAADGRRARRRAGRPADVRARRDHGRAAPSSASTT